MTTTYKSAVKSTKTYKTIDYDAMTKESFKIAEKLYDGVTENKAVPQAYLDKNTPMAYERLVIGGYRLYYTIDYIFGDSNEAPKFMIDDFNAVPRFMVDDFDTEFLQ